MTKEFLQMSKLYFDEATKSFSFDEEIDNVEQVINCASKQGALYYVLSALLRLHKQNKISLDDNTVNKINSSLLNHIIKSSSKYEIFKKVILQLENENINYCILKGEAFSKAYHSPSLRGSGDIDILIDEADEEKSFALLRNMGFKIEVRTPSSNHSVCTHPQMGILELHIRLNYDFIGDIWFQGEDKLTERYIKITSENGYTFNAPGITDGYLLAIFHAVKHFLNDGVGLRNIADIIQYQKFANSVLGIAVKYFGFEKDEFNPFEFDENLSDLILEDAFKYGIFGSRNNNEKLWMVYTPLRYKALYNKDFKENISKIRKEIIKNFASFKKDNLKRLYPKNSVFTSVFLHTFNILKKSVKKFSVIKQALKIDKKISDDKKGEIIQKLDMI